ncbi:hypothetical protein PsorP6_009453 [Peronosclerospora sorghi]|uniref:Uncharacterized protein n=1 Tax=Peronosclerospora sorghi TaxID=230839 RepID=A0ACC0VZD5_9STRA|nr:hypothetical protein PsorP6_009453 [Peronosclerospora sorghi]
MRGRYENHLKTYRQERGLATATGFGITEQVIDTLEKKQESLCIVFKRMYDLFESRDNVTPAFTVELGSLAGVKAVSRAPSPTGSEGNEQVVPNSCPGTTKASLKSQLEEQAEEGSPPPVAEEELLGEPLGTLVINAANSQEDSVQPDTSAEDPPTTPAEASIPETPAVLEQTPVPTTGEKKRRAETPRGIKGLEGLFEKRDNLWMTYLQSKESKEGEERRRQRYIDERRLEMEEKRFELDLLRLESETQRFMLEAEEKKRKERQAFIL